MTNLGYQVFTADNGIQAVSIYKQKQDEIDLVLLDMIMPELAGKETYEELKKLNPDIRVILMSGFSQNGKAAKILEAGVFGFLKKPFKLNDLSIIVSNALKK